MKRGSERPSNFSSKRIGQSLRLLGAAGFRTPITFRDGFEGRWGKLRHNGAPARIEFSLLRFYLIQLLALLLAMLELFPGKFETFLVAVGKIGNQIAKLHRGQSQAKRRHGGNGG